MTDKILAIGPCNARDLERLGAGLSRAYPVDQGLCFDDLLIAIDNADRSWGGAGTARQVVQPLSIRPKA